MSEHEFQVGDPVRVSDALDSAWEYASGGREGKILYFSDAWDGWPVVEFPDGTTDVGEPQYLERVEVPPELARLRTTVAAVERLAGEWAASGGPAAPQEALGGLRDALATVASEDAP